jgi:adenylate cyclase class 2
MPIEMELKVKVESHAPHRERLREAGATQVGIHLETNTFFDNDDRSLLASDKGLRIRVNRDLATDKAESILTYKGPRQPGAFKSREECEVTFDSAENLATILKSLGLVQVLSFEKKRESWKLAACKVELDEVPYLGCFLEVEGPSEKAIKEVQQKLGLEKTPTVRESYAGMLTTWLQERGSREKVVIFPKSA